jgi:hypothetical protein
MGVITEANLRVAQGLCIAPPVLDMTIRFRIASLLALVRLIPW